MNGKLIKFTIYQTRLYTRNFRPIKAFVFRHWDSIHGSLIISTVLGLEPRSQVQLSPISGFPGYRQKSHIHGQNIIFGHLLGKERSQGRIDGCRTVLPTCCAFAYASKMIKKVPYSAMSSRVEPATALFESEQLSHRQARASHTFWL